MFEQRSEGICYAKGEGESVLREQVQRLHAGSTPGALQEHQGHCLPGAG